MNKREVEIQEIKDAIEEVKNSTAGSEETKKRNAVVYEPSIGALFEEVKLRRDYENIVFFFLPKNDLA